MKTLNPTNLLAYSLGATLLGSGGGGHPKILYDLISYLMDIHGIVKILSISDLKEDDLVVPLAMVGAPLIFSEKIPNTCMFDELYTNIKKDYPHKRIVLMPAEIGGCNALTPMILALKYSLPILDADLIGRAFPKINMCKPAVLKRPCNPTYVSDLLGNSIRLDLNRLELLELMVRDITVRFGSFSGIATFLFDGKNAENYIIEGSISHALEYGQQLLNPRDFISSIQATLIGDGVITDVYHEMKNGFLLGHTIIKNNENHYKIYYQNEYLKICKNGVDVDGSPNIIAIIEKKTGQPLTSEALVYGIDVYILSINAPSFWTSLSSLPIVDYKLLDLEAL